MIKGGPKIIDDSLVLCLDAHDAKSYAGEPASNLNSDTNDYTGTSYSYFGEWTSNPTRLSKSYDSTIKTPIGTGATLIQESGTNGYHHLSRMGGSETGNHTISFYFKPVTSDINNLKIGMLGDSGSIITFDFTQSPVAVTQTGSAISGKLALLAPLSNGWYFCAADFNGRSGGWIGCVGFNINAEYTGVLGSKKAYICGLNYNTKAYALPSFDRSATDGWVDRSGNSNDGTLVNGTDTGVSHYRDGQVIMPVANSYLDFDGTNDYVVTSSNYSLSGSQTFEVWFMIGGGPSSPAGLLTQHDHAVPANFGINHVSNNKLAPSIGYTDNTREYSSKTTVTTFSHDTLYHAALVYDSSAGKVIWYVNGVYDNQYTLSKTPQFAAKPFQLGRWSYNYNSYYYNGRVYKASVYGNALTAQKY
jgi:hypothetical protein